MASVKRWATPQYWEVIYVRTGSVASVAHAIKATEAYRGARRRRKANLASLDDGVAVYLVDLPGQAVSCAVEYRDSEPESSDARIGIASRSGVAGEALLSEALAEAKLAWEVAAPGQIIVTTPVKGVIESSPNWRERIREVSQPRPQDKVTSFYRLCRVAEAPEPRTPGVVTPPTWAELLADRARKKYKERHGADASENVVDPCVIDHRWRELKASMAFGLFLILALAAATHRLSESRFGESLRNAAYDQIQQLFPAPSGRPKVTVLDIGSIDKIPTEGPDNGRNWTDYKALLRIIDAAEHMHPAAIAVDIDVGEHEYGSAPGAEELYRACRQFGNVYLGVDWALRLPPEQRLDGAENATMAVHGGVPIDGRSGMMSLSLAANERPVPSIAEALARRVRSPSKPSIWCTELVEMERPSPLEGRRFYVNYSVVDPLMRELRNPSQEHKQFLSLTRAEDLNGHDNLIEHRMVLIGDTKDGDLTRIPGRDGSYPGVFVQAAAADSQASKWPLRVFQPWAEAVLDIVSGLVVLAGSIGIPFRRIALKRAPSERNVGAVLQLMLVACTIALGFLLTASLRIIWLNFVLMVVVASAHSWIEDLAVIAWTPVSLGYRALRRRLGPRPLATKLLTTLALGLCVSHAAAKEPVYIATLSGFTGKVWFALRYQKTERQLTDRDCNKLSLRAGDRFRLAQGGSVSVLYRAEAKPQILAVHGSYAYVPNNVSAERLAALEVVDRLIERRISKRSGQEPLFGPAEDDFMPLADLRIFRCRDNAPATRLTFYVAGHSKSLGSLSITKGELRVAASGLARKLRPLQREAHPLELTLCNPNQDEPQGRRFYLLSRSDERKLGNALLRADAEYQDLFQRRIERAALCGSFGCRTLCEQELVAALAIREVEGLRAKVKVLAEALGDDDLDAGR